MGKRSKKVPPPQVRQLKKLSSEGSKTSRSSLSGFLLLIILVIVVCVSLLVWWKWDTSDVPVRSEQWLKHKKILLKRYESGERNFDEESLTWMENSDDPQLLLIAASLYSMRHDPYAIKVLEKVVFLFSRSDVTERDKKFTADTLSTNYLKEGNLEMKNLLSEICVQTMEEPEEIYSHYQAILHANWHSDIEKATYYAQQCKETFDITFPNFVPGLCYIYLGIQQRALRNHRDALEIFSDVAQKYSRVWLDGKGKPCPALYVPLSVHVDDKKVKEAQKSREIAIVGGIQSSRKECSSQKWAYYVQGNVREEVKTDEYFKMGCHPAEAIIYDFPNVEISDLFVYSEKSSKKRCKMYIPSFPFAGLGIDRLSSTLEQQAHQNLLPATENHVIQIQIYANYYHMFVEGSVKLYLIAHHEAFKNIPDLKLLAPSTPSFFPEIIDLFGLSDRVIPVVQRLQAKHVYDVCWRPKYPPVHKNRELAFDIEEFYLPPVSLLREVRDYFHSVIPVSGKRNLVVFVHREHGRRSIRESKELYDSLRKISLDYGMEFRLQGESSVREQIESFSRAVVVIGVHGAGLANILCCQENTTVLELPPDPLKTSVYSRMSSALNLNYYSIPHATFGLFEIRQSITPRELEDIESFLHYSLSQFTLQ